MAMVQRGPLPADNFTMLSNEWVRDRRLSFKARGVLAWLSSHSVGFRVSLDRIAAASEGDGLAAVRSAVAELEQVGYLERRKERDAKGRITARAYVLCDPNAQVTPNMQFSHDGETPLVGESTDGETAPLKKNNTPKKTTQKNPPAQLALVEAEQPITAQTIIASWIDWCQDSRDHKVPSRVVKQAAQQVKQLLADGYPDARIKSALAAMIDQKKSAGALTYLVQYGTQPTTQRPSTTDLRVAAGAELIARFAQMEASNEPV